MDIEDYDSPVRNPSPPPEIKRQHDSGFGDSIGGTAFSKHWLFTKLMKLIEEVDNEEKQKDENCEFGVDVDEDLQTELCKLWDMSMNQEVATFMQEFKTVDILTGVIAKSRAPRVTKVIDGIIHILDAKAEPEFDLKMALRSTCLLISFLKGDGKFPWAFLETWPVIRKLVQKCLPTVNLSQDKQKSQQEMCNEKDCYIFSKYRFKKKNMILLLLDSPDPPTLIQATRLLYTCLSNHAARNAWILKIKQSDLVLDHMKFIMASSMNVELLKNVGELTHTILDADEEFCESWGTVSLVEAMLEAVEQIGSYPNDALEVYLLNFHLLSTTMSGAEALVMSAEKLQKPLVLYLKHICEDEIVGLESRESCLAAVLSIVSILLKRSTINTEELLKVEHVPRFLMKILEPLYPLVHGEIPIDTMSRQTSRDSEECVVHDTENASAGSASAANCDSSRPAADGASSTATVEMVDEALLILYQSIQNSLLALALLLPQNICEGDKWFSMLKYLDTSCSRRRLSYMFLTLDEGVTDQFHPVKHLATLAQEHNFCRLSNIINAILS